MKRKSVFSLLLCLLALLCAAVLTSCGGTPSKEDERLLLCGFESWEELVKCNFVHSFGKAEAVSEEGHVTQGNACGKLTVDGSKNTATQRPTMILYTGANGVGKTDYSDVKAFELDAFLAGETARDISLQFEIAQTSGSGQVIYPQSALYRHTLQPGVQEHIVWEFDRGFLSEFLDIGSVVQIMLVFDNPVPGTRDVFYLDNFNAVLTDTAIPKVQVRREGEIESADRAEYLAAWSVTMPLHAPMSLSYNEDPDFVKAGAGSLKIESVPKGETTWPTWDLNNKILTDVSAYRSLVFWMYNANAEDHTIYGYESYVLGVAKAGAWTRFEVPVANLSEISLNQAGDKMDPTHFTGFRFTVVNPANTTLTFYLDEFWAVKEDTRPPEIGEVSYERQSFGAEVEIAVPDVVRGALDGWKIYDPEDALEAENAERFVPEKRGVYRIVYAASNEYETVESEVLLYVGYPIIYQTEYSRSEKQAFSYTVPVFRTDADSTLGWKLYNWANGEPVGEANAASYEISEGAFYLEYTATNDFGSTTCRVDLAARGALTLLEEYYGDFFGTEGWESASGTVSVVTGGAVPTLYGGKTFRMVSISGASVTLKTPVLLGSELSMDRIFTFNVYNPTDSAIQFTYSQGAATIPAKSWKQIYIPLQWLSLWSATTQNADGSYALKDFAIAFNGAGTLYVEGFSISDAATELELAFDPYETSFETDGETLFAVPKCLTPGYTVKLVDKSTGAEVLLDAQERFTPAKNGVYEATYTAQTVYDTASKTITLNFRGAAPTIAQTVFSRTSENAFTYSVPVFETTAGGVLTWQLYSCADGTPSGDANASSYEIPVGEYYLEYTATNDAGAATCRTYLTARGAFALLEEHYAQFYGDDLGGLATSYRITEDPRVLLYGGKAIELDSSAGANVIVGSGVLLGNALTHDRELRFSVFNPGNESVYLTYGMGGDTIPARSWKTVCVYFDWLAAWELTEADADGNYFLKDFKLIAGSGSLYLEGFRISDSATVPAFRFGSYESAAETDGATAFAPPPCLNAGATVSVSEKSSGANVPLGGDGKFMPEVGKTYVFRYTIATPYGNFDEEIEVTYRDGRYAKFSGSLPANAVVAAGTSIKDYVDGHPMTSADGTVRYLVSYYATATATPSGALGGSYDAANPLTTQTFSTSWAYAVDWTAENEFGFSTHRQWIFVQPAGSKNLESTAATVTLNGNAAFVETDGATFGTETAAIRIDGNAQILSKYTVAIDSSNHATFGFFLVNRTNEAVRVVINESNFGTFTVAANGGIYMDTATWYGNAWNYCDANKNLSLNITVTTDSGAPAELYLGWIHVGESVSVTQPA